ncbi:MAG: NADH-quinone oxidoreductase subunit L, partial [Chitinivibrionales bacterium]|nr:NADH-quinone oxidoreductase subunit L [Chitinivibrionales bacterium]
VITLVGTLIHVYSTAYMGRDKGYARYFSYLNLFLSSMLVLVMGSNLALMFLGWEGVGLCSYLLISFWFTDEAKASAGKKAFITNRIGDFGFMLGIFCIFTTLAKQGSASLEFSFMAAHAETLAPVATLIALLRFMGAAGKSAQIPLYVWLPDAMAGPTPVSALIHAATMVTAGVFMVARMHFIYDLAPLAGQVVAGVGIATALLAAIIGMAQNDIKKALAYSTVSQLGFMFVGVGTGAYHAGIFHVFTHAFFKACLFLCAGSVIHALHEEQDIRNMGGLLKRLPITGATFLVAWLAICGIPPLSGFFSKDEILLGAFNAWGAYGKVLWALGLAGAAMTAFYMSRLTFLVFFGENRTKTHAAIHESPPAMTIPLVILAAGSALVGFLGMPESWGTGNFFGSWLRPVFDARETAQAGSAPELALMAASVGAALLGMAIAWKKYYRKPLVAQGARGIVAWSARAFFVDELYQGVLLKPLFAVADRILFRIVDVIIIDGCVNASAKIASGIGALLRTMQTGSVRTYLYYVAAGALTLMVIVFMGGLN